MTWTKLLANKEAERHKTSKKELDLVLRESWQAIRGRPCDCC